MRFFAPLLLALVSSSAAAQVSFERPDVEAASDSCGRSVGLIGAPILDLESFLVRAGHPTRVARDRRDMPGLLASDPDVIFILRGGADTARAHGLELDRWVRAGGLLITEFRATQILYEAGPLHYLNGALIDDFWIPSGSACGGNAIRVEANGHPMAQGLPAAWACSGNPMGTFQLFSGVDPRLCVVLTVLGPDPDGDGLEEPVLGVTRVGLGSVAPFFSDMANFGALQDPRNCPGGPSSADCFRSVFDEQVLLNVICHGDELAPCGGCTDCDALSDTLAGAAIDNAGVRTAMEATLRNACEQLRRGRLIPAGNALCAFSHQIDAQDGKHLGPASADDLRRCLAEVSESAGLRPTLPLFGCGGRPVRGAPGGRRR